MNTFDAEAAQRLREKPFVFSVGLEKCGTTSFSDFLGMARNVSVPPPKELDYFFTNYDKGVDWFLGNYDEGKEIFIDFTPSYHWSLPCLERIQQDCDNKVIVLLLRHPIERAYSAYTHQRHWFFETEFKEDGAKRFNKSFTELVEIADRFVFPSYLDLIRRVTSVFKEPFVKIIPLEFLLDNPWGYVESIESLLSHSIALDRDATIPHSNALYMPQFYSGRELIAATPDASPIVSDLDAVYISRGGVPSQIAPGSMAGSLREMGQKWLETVDPDVLTKAYRKFYENEIVEIERLLGVNLDIWRVNKPKRPRTVPPISKQAARSDIHVGLWYARFLFSKRDKKDEALNFLAGEIASHPSEAGYHGLLAQFHLELKDYVEADRHSLRAFQLAPKVRWYSEIRKRVLLALDSTS